MVFPRWEPADDFGTSVCFLRQGSGGDNGWSLYRRCAALPAEYRPRRSEVYLASLPLAVWEAGKHYRYTFTISDNDRILFDTPTVNAWTEAVGGIIIVD